MKQQLILKRGETTIKVIPLPEFGEVTITTHNGEARNIDTLTKELFRDNTREPVREQVKPRLENHDTVDRTIRERKAVEGPL